jgi:hypothetical protein
LVGIGAQQHQELQQLAQAAADQYKYSFLKSKDGFHTRYVLRLLLSPQLLQHTSHMAFAAVLL